MRIIIERTKTMLYIKNGRIKTMAGMEYPNGQILIADGKIRAVGENVEKPEGAREIDAGGHLVTPGMIDAHCHVGLFGSALRWEGDDGNEEMDPITPHLRGIDSVNPQDECFENARKGGVTTIATGPGSGNVIGGITSYLAYKYEMTQALSSWLVGHFSLVLKGRYEIVGLTVPLVALAFVFANHFNIVGLGKDFSRNLGVPYNLVLFSGLTISAMITASIVVVVGSISYIGLIVPNVVAMYKGDRIRGTLADTALFGAIFVLVCDMIGRVVIFPYELPIELIVGILGSLIFIALLFCRLKYGRRAIRLGGTGTGCCSAMPGLKGGAEQ